MKAKLFIILSAVTLCCAGCVSQDNTLGESLIPVNHIYRVVSPDPVEIPVRMEVADSLSAYSSTRITIGAIRNDSEFGVSTRSSCLTLVPLFVDSLDFGTNPVPLEFHFSASVDSTSVSDRMEQNIIQNVFVYELSEALDESKTYCRSLPEHSSDVITTNLPIITPGDSLSFDFNLDFAKKYLDIKSEDLKDLSAYTKRFPGICITTGKPVGQGGRFNIFNLQLAYDSDYGYLMGNMAKLRFNSTWEEDGVPVQKDSSFYFYFSPTDFFDIDSLLTNSGTGSFPQYCANLTKDASSAYVGDATDYVYVEGGAGVKPVVSAEFLRRSAIERISANGHDPSKAVINKASLTFHYVAPDPLFETMYKVPEILSPTCRIKGEEAVSFMGLTDASDSNEDQGSRHLAQMTYSPDITYHLQTLLGLKDDNEQLLNGSYDVWLLIMHNDVVTTTTSGNSELSEYYNYLAYQSYMGDMYGGYGYGYGSYGYGYNNYYNYSMMAQMYGSSTTTSSVSVNLDRDRYYYCRLYGPEASDASLRPTFSFTYSIPGE